VTTIADYWNMIVDADKIKFDFEVWALDHDFSLRPFSGMRLTLNYPCRSTTYDSHDTEVAWRTWQSAAKFYDKSDS
jgi:hypothetical protein